MKKVKLSRKALEELNNALDTIQAISFDSNDDKGSFMAFKFALGRNYERTHNAYKELVAEPGSEIIMKGDLKAEFDEFLAECDEYVTANYAILDDDGVPMLDQNGDMLIKEQPDLSHLLEKYSDTIEKKNKIDDKLTEFYKGEVEVELEEIELMTVPVNLTGSYINALKLIIKE